MKRWSCSNHILESDGHEEALGHWQRGDVMGGI